MSIFTKVFGDPNEKVVKSIKPLVERINSLEGSFASLSNDQLKLKTAEFKERLHTGDVTLDDLLPEAFAVCREAAKRVIGQRHFDVQLIGGIVLHRGQIAEMRTGEGKTLMATLPVYLNALAGDGVHVVTVNDYLARRDAVWMGQVYHALGLSVSCIQHEASFLFDPTYNNEQQQSEHEGADAGVLITIEQEKIRPCSRKQAYAADITYGTNNEFGFDYLRDNLAQSLEAMSQRTLSYAIIDEVDSILIDEARTPLIISAPAEESTDEYYRFAQLVGKLQVGDDYNIDEKMKAATLTEPGLKKLEEWLGMKDFYTVAGIKTVHHIEQALKAHALFKRDRDYVVKDGEVIIVDEFTGRLMQGRRYSEGLHQAIEAQEGVVIQRESQTYATVSFQNLFRLYKKLAGMTGTAVTEAEEFYKIYKLEVVSVPPNRAVVRKDLGDRVYKNERGKFTAVVQEVRARNEKGQPVLVGTVSIEKNEVLSQMLEREGITHEVLNAKNHEREAEIIAQAGRKGAVTIATNMAGRGVDIILGGNPPDKQAAEEVRALGGLHIIGTERHESRRIDNQLRGRAGRQGDQGSTQFYVSMEDDLMRIFGSDRMKGLMDRMGVPEDMPIENGVVSRSIEEAQKKVEGHNFDIRKHLVEYDDVINKHRELIYKRRRDVLQAYVADTTLEVVPDQTPVSQLRAMMLAMVEEEIEQVVMFHTRADQEKEWNLQEIYEVVNTIFPIPQTLRVELEQIEHTAGDKLADAQARTRIIQYLVERAKVAYSEFENSVIVHFGQQFPGISAYSALRQIEKDLMIRAIDSLWVEHLEAIDHLRTGIGLRGYGQRDPLVEYKREAYRLFTELLSLVNKQVVYTIYKIGLSIPSVPKEESMLPRNAVFMAPAKEGDSGVAASSSTGPMHKIGRNDPCPCGSLKPEGTPLKYKHCHGKNE